MRHHFWLVLPALLVPAIAAAQDLPPYVPVNPVLASRSALYAQPFIPSRPGWHVRWVTDYSNAVEVSTNPDQRHYLLDAELLETDVWITHDLSHRIFVIGDIALRGGYAGFLDGFLNAYHDIVGFKVPARNQRPANTFAWEFELPDFTVKRSRPGTFLGDLRMGIGWRTGRAQLIGTVTLPTTTTHVKGWGRDVVGTSLALSANLLRSSRVVGDASATVGSTPATGLLAPYQRTVFGGGFTSWRWRFAGRQAVFATAWVQSANYRGTGLPALDDPEITLDFGALLRIHRSGPELQLGLTEDLRPRGPAVDLGLKVGLRW